MELTDVKVINRSMYERINFFLQHKIIIDELGEYKNNQGIVVIH